MRAEITTGAKGANQTGGDIVIDATHLTTLKDVNLRTGLNPSDQIAGGGGAVSLTAPSVQGSNLTIDASAAGPGGDVSIRASGDITLQNSNISSGSFLGEGDSGNITVQAAKLTLTESGIGSLSDGLHARIGNIIIDVGRLTMQGVYRRVWYRASCSRRRHQRVGKGGDPHRSRFHRNGQLGSYKRRFD